MQDVARVKVVLVGPLDAGKTNLANNLSIPGFNEQCDSTEGISFIHLCATVGEDTQGEPECGPLLGQESDGSITASTFRKALIESTAAARLSTQRADHHRAPVYAQPQRNPGGATAEGPQPPQSDIHLQLVSEITYSHVDHLTESAVFVDMLDCGGQLSFSILQALAFDANDGVFLLVYKSCISLNEKLVQAFRLGRQRIPLLPVHLTHGEYLATWLSTLAMARSSEASKPIVALIGTHSVDAHQRGVLDRSHKEATELMKKFQDQLDIRGPFFVDNSRPSSKEMASLRRQVHQFVRDKADFKPTPLSFLAVEWALKRQVKNGTVQPCVSLGTFTEFAVTQFQVAPNKVSDLLDGLHRSSVVRSFNHRDPAQGGAYVYQSTAWFIDQISKVLSTAMVGREGVYSLHADIEWLKTRGVLTIRLCEKIWSHLEPSVWKSLLFLMEKFGLLCPVADRSAYEIPEAAGELYLIPMCIQRPPGLHELPPGTVSLLPVLLYIIGAYLPYPIYMRVLVGLLQEYKPATPPEIDVRKARFCCSQFYFAEVSFSLQGIALAVFCTDHDAAAGHVAGVQALNAIAARLFNTTGRMLAQLRDESWKSLADWCPAFQCPDHSGGLYSSLPCFVTILLVLFLHPTQLQF